VSDAAHFPPRRPATRNRRKSFDFEKLLKTLKLWAFDLGMTIGFFVMLYCVVIHAIGR
jgi:hypothetical protein